MGAGLPANTGTAGATHRVVCFAGKPAPTGGRGSLKLSHIQ
ncbi:diguanylate cyclase [Pseudomonas putida]|nr:diguanylate cyclase [Pseudomonas putida]